MYQKKVTQNQGENSPFFEFLIKYWFILVALIFAVPYVFRFIREQGIKNLEQDEKLQVEQNQVLNANPNNETTARQNITKLTGVSSSRGKELAQISHNLAHYLGFIYPMWDPRSWTEDDELIYLEFRKMKQTEIQTVKNLYYSVDAPGRNLQDDCRKVLDEKYYKLINW
jgi:hypothetical protein